jgi:hypothetical protein
MSKVYHPLHERQEIIHHNQCTIGTQDLIDITLEDAQAAMNVPGSSSSTRRLSTPLFRDLTAVSPPSSNTNVNTTPPHPR